METPDVESALEALARRAPRMHLTTALRLEVRAEAGRADGALAGMPIVVKDAFVDAERVPTCGSRVPARWLTGTAQALERLRAAGAVIVGYANLHEWGVGTTSVVTATGPIHNPRVPGRIAGGSSGGSAACVAAGLVPAAVGSDAAGSIRVPAACCAVVGLKPSFGRVPTSGFVGDGCRVDHVGPIARTVAGARRLLAAMCDDDLAAVDVAALRVGVARRHFFEGVDARIGAGVDAAVRLLSERVADVRDVEVAGAEEAARAAGRIMLAFTAERLRRPLLEEPDAFDPDTRARLERGAALDERRRAEAEATMHALRESWSRVFEEVDVVVTPTIPAPPPRLDAPAVDLVQAERGHLASNAAMNLGGVPALSLPRGATPGDGSVTLTAARGRDEVVLALGEVLEEDLAR